MIFVMFVCLFDYIFVTFTSKCFYLFLFVIYTCFSFDKCLERVLDLLEWRLKLLKPKGESLECSRVVKMFTSHPPSLLSRLFKALWVVNLAFSHESWTIHESSTCQRFQESQIFRFEQLFCFENNFVHRCPNWVIQVDMER